MPVYMRKLEMSISDCHSKHREVTMITMLMCACIVLSYVHAAGMHATSEIHVYTTCVCIAMHSVLITNMYVLTNLHVYAYRTPYQ